MQQALAELNQNAKPIMALVGELIGSTAAMMMYYYFAKMKTVLIIMLAIPPFIVGVFSRFMGCTYKLKHRLPAGILAAIVHMTGCWFMGVNPLFYLLTPVAFAIAFIVAKVKLEPVHDWAIDQDKYGQLYKNSGPSTDQN